MAGLQLPHLLRLALSRTARAEHAAAANAADVDHAAWLHDLRDGDTDADRITVARRHIARTLALEEGDR